MPGFEVDRINNPSVVRDDPAKKWQRGQVTKELSTTTSLERSQDHDVDVGMVGAPSGNGLTERFKNRKHVGGNRTFSCLGGLAGIARPW